ncbi:MAG: flippase-like domain-containing protein [Acidobacteria bacterium]|nr:flippase-like domain-containing protein [Acidobacteriota bacterium]
MKSRLLSVVSLLIGIALFVHLLKQTGTAEILARVQAMGAGFLLILAISGTRQLARSYAWLRCMSDDDRRVGLWAVLRARLAGDALADLTAAGPVIGEPVKIAQLKGKIRLSNLASSLAVENLTYAISSGLLVLAGTLTLLVLFAVADNIRTASLLALLIVSVSLLTLLFSLTRRWKIFSTLMSSLVGFLPQLSTVLPRVHELENYIFDFYERRRADFLVVACCDFLFHLAGVLEIYATLYLIGFSATFINAFILEAVNRVMNIVFAFVPAMIGVDEAGTGLLTSILGLGTGAGIAIAIIRKARMFVWIGLGVIFLALGQKQNEK